ncbi:MAG: hypothetical protein ABR915_12665 [Thermoguttaceae bacterium]|jgi:hypothetical protein
MAGLIACTLMGGTALAQDKKAPAKPKLDPNNAVWALTLGGAYLDKPLTLHLATSGGKVVRAFGLGEFNKAVHDVDGSALAIAAASLKGPAKVTINADQWFPADGKPIECRFDLDIAVKDGKIGGAYKGKRGNDEVSGMALGTIQPPLTEIRSATIKMELDKALEGNVNQQRVYMTVNVTGGKVGEVKVAPKDRFHWQARVKDSKLAVTPEAVTGEVAIEVNQARSVTDGTYTFTLDGKVIGSKVAGKFTSKLGDKPARGPAAFNGSF